VTYRVYKDADLVVLPNEAAAKGVALEPGGAQWLARALAVLVLAGAGGAFVARALRKRAARTPEADPMPAQITPFSALRFLNRCAGASGLPETERSKLEREIQALEARCFGREATPPAEPELRALLERYRGLAASR
jgi:hypothetical protein